MTKETMIIALIIIGLAYYYWQHRNHHPQSTGSPDHLELNDNLSQPAEKEVTKDNLGNSLPDLARPILSHKQKRQLKKQPKK